MGLSWQTVFAAIRVKYSSPPMIYPTLSHVSVWKRWFMPVFFCLPALLWIIQCGQVCLSQRYDLGFQRPSYGYMSWEKVERRELWVRSPWLWEILCHLTKVCRRWPIGYLYELNDKLEEDRQRHLVNKFKKIIICFYKTDLVTFYNQVSFFNIKYNIKNYQWIISIQHVLVFTK